MCELPIVPFEQYNYFYEEQTKIRTKAEKLHCLHLISQGGVNAMAVGGGVVIFPVGFTFCEVTLFRYCMLCLPCI